MKENYAPSTEQIASEAGITTAQARIAVTAALRALHRCSTIDSRGLTAGLMETYFCFGSEACYHFMGLLELQRTRGDPDLPWSETLQRFAPEVGQYREFLEQWMASDTSPSSDTPEAKPSNNIPH